MKYLYTLLAFSILAFGSCKKDKNREAITVTILAEAKGEMNKTVYAAEVIKREGKTYDFFCDLGPGRPAMPQYNCAQHVYIRNLPASLAIVGKTISFTRYKDYGQNLVLSSINHAHELDIYDPEEVR